MTASIEKHPFKHLLTPINMGPVRLKNRIALAPMNEVMSGLDGQVTEQEVSYYAARAKGGTGLIITGAIMATKLASQGVWGRNMYCFKPGHLQGLNQLTERVHYFGAQICAQMSIGFGRQGHTDDENELVPAPTGGLPYESYLNRWVKSTGGALRKSPRGRLFLRGQMTREMSIDEIHSEQKEFARSVQLAVCAGFDAIELHCPHGYLEHEFLSPITNKRTDMYGGNWHNRKRFVMEIAEQTRYSAGPNVAVGARLSAEEHMEGGLTREEMIDVAKELEKRGFDFIDLSDGAGYLETDHLAPDEEQAAHFPDQSADFKRAVKIPVFCQSIHDPVLAESIIAEGKADIIDIARQLYCDPEWANKVIENRPGDIVRCKRCNTCLARNLSAQVPAYCPQNPNLGREWALDEYRLGPRRKDEPILPRGMAGLPALEKPWWMPDVPAPEKDEAYPFRGPGEPGGGL